MVPIKDKQKFDVSLLTLFLFFIAVLQGSSQFLEFYYTTANKPESALLNIWLSLGNKMAENWVAFSVSLICLVLGCLLYNSLAHKSSFPGNNLRSVGLLLINLALCLRVYSSSSVSDKIAYFTANLPTVSIVLIIVFFVMGSILVIQKERKNTEELDRLYSELGNDLEAEMTNDVRGTDSGQPDWDTRTAPDMAFRLKHPFSYAYRSFVRDWEVKRKIKREHKHKLLQMKTETEQRKKNAELERLNTKNIILESKGERFFGYLSVFLAFLICAGLVYLLFTTEEEQSLGIIKRITEFILSLTDILDDATNPLTNFLLSSGVLFLFFILLLTLFLLAYIMLRVIAYLLFHPNEDTTRIQKIGKAIKIFFFDILDGVLRPLLFLPDFLECLETMLLDTNLDYKIDGAYPPVEPSSQSLEVSESDTPDQE